MTEGIADALVTSQLAGSRLVSQDLGIDPDTVSAGTVVHAPAGEVAGSSGVEAFVATLRRHYPGAQFAVTDSNRVVRLFIVGWQGTRDGDVIAHGRTLITSLRSHS